MLYLDHKFIVIKAVYQDGGNTRIGFGIAATSVYDDIVTILESVSDISPNENEVAELAETLNSAELDLIHFQDALNDFFVDA